MQSMQSFLCLLPTRSAEVENCLGFVQQQFVFIPHCDNEQNGTIEEVLLTAVFVGIL